MSTTNTLFVMVASILVFFMTPGLAFFYGGMVSRRNSVNTLLSVFFISGLAIILGSTSSSVDQEISALHCKIGLKESSARMVPFSLPGFVFP